MSKDTTKGGGLQLRPAQRKKAKLRIGLSGTSGSGKTYSALLMASGIVPWNKIAVIDTENGSAELYSDLGEYNVITLEDPYSPERYIQAIEAAENAGMELIIIDSVTHEWDGKGGCLEINENVAQAKFKGNTWAAWSQTNTRHQAFLYKIVSSKCHVITTARSKQDTVQIDGKVKKVGTKEIQREGFEYELTVNFNLDRDGNLAVASKDRTGIFSNEDPFKVSKKTGKTLIEWANSGIDPKEEAIKRVKELLVQKGKEEDKILFYYEVDSLSDLDIGKLKAAAAKLEKFEDAPEEPVGEDDVDSDQIADDVEQALGSKENKKVPKDVH